MGSPDIIVTGTSTFNPPVVNTRLSVLYNGQIPTTPESNFPWPFSGGKSLSEHLYTLGDRIVWIRLTLKFQ